MITKISIVTHHFMILLNYCYR